MARLETSNHPRYEGDARYIYPVVSRRAQGVSIGVNLNPNDACNWRCVYCQVPNLKSGKGPAIDLERLGLELELLLDDLIDGDFMQRRVPEGSRRLNDIAFSGNGEPTSSPNFQAAIEVVGDQLAKRALIGKLKLVLITNGSLMHKPDVQSALERLADLGGEVWFKLDGASDGSLARFNNTSRGIDAQLANLRIAASLAPTFVQTAVFRFGSECAAPMDGDFDAYCQNLVDLLTANVALKGVHLYSLARESHQPEGKHLHSLSMAELGPLAQRLEAIGLTTTANA